MLPQPARRLRVLYPPVSIPPPACRWRVLDHPDLSIGMHGPGRTVNRRHRKKSKMARDPYRHYKNYGQSGDAIFVTTTCLDFVHAFARPEIADLMTASLLHDCLELNLPLSGFVVMPHHFHAIIYLQNGIDASSAMNRIKSNSAKRVKRKLTLIELAKFNEQTGLNRRSFWQRSFRSFQIETEEAFLQKLHYIHMNPVKSELCVAPENYRWSSAHFWLAGKTRDWMLEYDVSDVERFSALADLDLSRASTS